MVFNFLRNGLVWFGSKKPPTSFSAKFCTNEKMKKNDNIRKYFFLLGEKMTNSFFKGKKFVRSSWKAFQRHQEHVLKHHRASVNLITTKQNKVPS
jgi:hypothetical protein